MLEKEIKEILFTKKIRPVDIYKPLKINRVNFYKAIKTSNLKNKSFKKIINFLELKLLVSLKNKYDNKKRVF
jgi:hypothetical protein